MLVVGHIKLNVSVSYLTAQREVSDQVIFSREDVLPTYDIRHDPRLVLILHFLLIPSVPFLFVLKERQKTSLKYHISNIDLMVKI